MKPLLLIAFVALLSLCSATDISDKINKLNAGWTAQRYNTNLNQKFGTHLSDPNPLPFRPEFALSQDLPDAFDARTQWPGCIGPVLDQGECGSCWAFGAVETLSVRFCIHSNSTVHVALSELNMVACDKLAHGCEGGAPSAAWDFASRTGLVTNSCIPYNETIPTCAATQQPCLNFVPTPSCPNKCSDGQIWENTIHYAVSGYSVRANEIQEEIMTNGPVHADYIIYEDFLKYKSGVYKHVYGRDLGGHSVKIIGWGN
eukprot:TRINITY_DN12479_c0_g1_i1.p1 TRINITY_DN12479_c0_g1~~TRINITY_DN12479_c0_g1_i1.p1  ORF type:complete len:266 (+),score=94.13 TRINITY_DN12479_c0_g1_i1:26-799(+)